MALAALAVTGGGNIEDLRVEIEERVQTRDIEATDAIQVVRDEIHAAVAAGLEVLLHAGDAGLTHHPVEPDARRWCQVLQRIQEGTHVQRPARGVPRRRRDLDLRPGTPHGPGRHHPSRPRQEGSPISRHGE